MDISDKYHLTDRLLGQGAYSQVKSGYNIQTDEEVAVKVIRKAQLGTMDLDAVHLEVHILRELCKGDDQKHVIHLYDYVEDDSRCYVIMEYMRGGELFDRIVTKLYYTEEIARNTAKKLLEAVAFMHSKNVVHRDLKPENLLLKNHDDDEDIRIADFGFGKELKTSDEKMNTQCGTPAYVAPEIITRDNYGKEIDAWSAGVIIYILLGGYPPFNEENQRDLFRKIKKGEYEFHDEFWGEVSNEAKDCISSLMCVNVSQRYTTEQALQHPWFTTTDDTILKRDMSLNLNKLLAFNAKRKFRAGVRAIVVTNRLERRLNFIKARNLFGGNRRRVKRNF